MRVDPVEDVVVVDVKVRKRQVIYKSPAVLYYYGKVGRWPNRAQILAVNEQVKDLEKWKGIVDLWLMKGWSQGNVDGMLKRYHKSDAVAEKGFDDEYSRYYGHQEAAD